MSRVIRVEELAEAIIEFSGEIAEEVGENLNTELKKIAKETADSLKNDSNIPQRTKDEESYKRLFYVKKTELGYVVANKKYQLTHLLENGHDIVRNGETVGRARAFPHWDRAQKEVDSAVNLIRGKLTGGQ